MEECKKSRRNGYQKVPRDQNRNRLRKGFDLAGGVKCKDCFRVRREMDLIKAENARLKQKIEYLESGGRKELKSTPGAHTPSSRIDFKKNSLAENQAKVGGAKLGHAGHGRSGFSEGTAPSCSIALPEQCQDCGIELIYKDSVKRFVLEAEPVKVRRVVYRCARGICPHCDKIYTAKPPALSRSLYGNSVLSQAANLHFMHGITLGKVKQLMGEEITQGGIIHALHRLGELCEGAMPKLVKDYRGADVKHADETGWRTDGESGYAWIFCNEETSIFEFRDTRASRISKEILGEGALPGVLVVDRYPGYNKSPIQIQYCYAHLLREVEKLEDEFNDNQQVVRFTSELGTLLSQAMKLRNRGLNLGEYQKEAEKIKIGIEVLIYTESSHVGVKSIQRIFRDKRERLYHWVKSPKIPAENNRAERELRPTVIARKNSFGSQSKRGARTRAVILSVLYTAKKRLKDKPVDAWLEESLNSLVKNPHLTLADLIPSPTGD